jgi:hypothetical protein
MSEASTSSSNSRPTSARRARLASAAWTAILLAGTSCAPDNSLDDRIQEEAEDYQDALSAAQKQPRYERIRDALRKRGVTNDGYLFAGIANAETGLVMCWSEATWACKGPVSPDCGGGPVIAGSGDGPCSLKEGGLGLFQFDAGTFNQTLAAYGSDVLTVEGQMGHAVDYVVEMVKSSVYTTNAETDAKALAWINAFDPKSAVLRDQWIKTVVRYYNGCQPSWSCWSPRYQTYTEGLNLAISEPGGLAFWSAADLAPLEVYWARQADGRYDLRALGPASVASVEYRVDGFEIGSATKTDGSNFPDSYSFTSEENERFFEVVGFDAANEPIARGIGSIDVTSGTAVYIKQMGAALYEIGLERAPAGAASVEVRADGFLLTDSVSGKSRSTRMAVRSKFSQLGSRTFAIRTFNADGTLRGTLTRSLTLE